MILSVLLFVTATAAQFIPAPTDLISTKGFLDIPVRYKEVPTGICELDPNVKRSVYFLTYSNMQSEIVVWQIALRPAHPTIHNLAIPVVI